MKLDTLEFGFGLLVMIVSSLGEPLSICVYNHYTPESRIGIKEITQSAQQCDDDDEDTCHCDVFILGGMNINPIVSHIGNGGEDHAITTTNGYTELIDSTESSTNLTTNRLTITKQQVTESDLSTKFDQEERERHTTVLVELESTSVKKSTTSLQHFTLESDNVPQASSIVDDQYRSTTQASSKVVDDQNRSTTEVEDERTTTGTAVTSSTTVYANCEDVPTSGVYLMKLLELDRPISVYCDMETSGGGWMVILRRSDGNTDFNLPMQDYIDGFGDLTGEFWLGLQILRNLTCGQAMASTVYDYDYKNGECYWELRVDVEDWSHTIANSNYDYIFIYGPRYKLNVGRYSGNAGDEFAPQIDRAFSAKDNDRDAALLTNLAQTARGGWWYNMDATPNLCGYYCNPILLNACSNSMNWGWMSSLKSASMRIRRVF